MNQIMEPPSKNPIINRMMPPYSTKNL